ncbi:hypothetical protein N7492_004818 [Penicillium capsulatum]|uniref:Zn(2)-C6 fungal-type domain-containing protein n=1 Tax=Penicillium capsulatum TaxID=69766 RepID=A0A9W9LRB9_9EURO|nr:hypothetical protein N7492_004818 [Penicillium capsulatum]KAJ6136073.1 hypothetical protein N7512_001233 [Penicillium capsulatum]
MPGKPWSSRGCRNCRSRKIKVRVIPSSPSMHTKDMIQCDEQQPECAACVKRGIKCGRPDQLRILFHQSDLSGDAKSKPAKGSSNQVQFAKRPRALVWQESVDSTFVYRAQLFGQYMDCYFPIQLAGALGNDPLHHLLRNFTYLPNKTKMLEHAISAASCVFMGKIRHDTTLLQEGLLLYNSAVRHMSQTINQKGYCDELVYAAAIFLAIEEVHCPGGLQAWIAHVHGLNALFKMCYPRIQSNHLLRAIYECCEIGQTLSSTIGTGGLAHPNDIVVRKSRQDPFGELLSIFSELSPAFKRAPSLDSADAGETEALLQNCLFHQTKIFDWYARRLEEIGGEPSKTSINLCPELSAEHLFGPAYLFSSLDNAKLHIMYWTIQGMTEDLISQVARHVTSHTADSATGSADHESSLLIFYMDEVSRAMPYILQDSMKAWGARSVLFFAGQICQAYLKISDWQKFVWSQKVLNRMGDFGMESAIRIGDVFWKLAVVSNPTLLPSEKTSEETGESWWEQVMMNIELTGARDSPRLMAEGMDASVE